MSTSTSMEVYSHIYAHVRSKIIYTLGLHAYAYIATSTRLCLHVHIHPLDIDAYVYVCFCGSLCVRLRLCLPRLDLRLSALLRVQGLVRCTLYSRCTLDACRSFASGRASALAHARARTRVCAELARSPLPTHASAGPEAGTGRARPRRLLRRPAEGAARARRSAPSRRFGYLPLTGASRMKPKERSRRLSPRRVEDRACLFRT